MKGLSVEQSRGFAERTQGRRANSQSSLDGLEGGSLLQGAQAGDRRAEEVEQQEADVLVVEQLAIARAVTLGTDVPESRQQRREHVEVFQALDVARL